MLKLQETLFFRSHIRKLLLAVLLFGGTVYHIRIFVREGAAATFQTYGYNWGIGFQLDIFIYYFILILFLAFDYFREAADAEVLDIIRTSKGAFESDFAQFVVMLQWIILSACIVLGFAVYGYGVAGTLTQQMIFYLCRLTFIYIGLNGIAAVLLAWLLARTTGRLLGYVCILLFSFMASPIATEGLGIVSMLNQSLHDLYKVFLIMPEGINAWNDWTLFPVNLTIASRSLFWIFLCLLGLVACSRSRYRMWLLIFMTLCLAGDFCYMYLPASFYSYDSSNSVSDSVSYDQYAYMLCEDAAAKQDESGFLVERYEMKFRFRRCMEASVSLFPDDGGLAEYKLTLYHLYDIKSVTNQSGTALPYKREGDYLTVYNDENSILESICIDYKGAVASFYANADSANLPGWFAYYPMPGFKLIYQDYSYVCNWLEAQAQFDIEVDTCSEVYSDLNQTGKNHFQGTCYGATLIGGFVKEVVLENGVRCVFPYLEKGYNPMQDAEKEAWEYVMAYFDGEWEKNEQKQIIFLPSFIYAPACFRDGTLLSPCSIRTLRWNLRETGSLNGEEKAPDREMAVDLFMTMYQLMSEASLDEMDYAFLKEKWDGYLKECNLEPEAEEAFEAFILEQLGQEEYNRIMETKQD